MAMYEVKIGKALSNVSRCCKCEKRFVKDEVRVEIIVSAYPYPKKRFECKYCAVTTLKYFIVELQEKLSMIEQK